MHHPGAPMKALVKAKAEPGLWLQDVPEPAIGPMDGFEQPKPEPSPVPPQFAKPPAPPAAALATFFRRMEFRGAQHLWP